MRIKIGASSDILYSTLDMSSEHFYFSSSMETWDDYGDTKNQGAQKIILRFP